MDSRMKISLNFLHQKYALSTWKIWNFSVRPRPKHPVLAFLFFSVCSQIFLIPVPLRSVGDPDLADFSLFIFFFQLNRFDFADGQFFRFPTPHFSEFSKSYIFLNSQRIKSDGFLHNLGFTKFLRCSWCEWHIELVFFSRRKELRSWSVVKHKLIVKNAIYLPKLNLIRICMIDDQQMSWPKLFILEFFHRKMTAGHDIIHFHWWYH